MPFGLRPSRHSHPPHFRRPRTFQAERQTEKGPPRDLERGRSRFSEKPVTFARFFQAIASTDEIQKQGYVLTLGRYVGIEEEEADDESFDEKLKRLTSELKQLFEKSSLLENVIKERLKEIGYDL